MKLYAVPNTPSVIDLHTADLLMCLIGEVFVLSRQRQYYTFNHDQSLL